MLCYLLFFWVALKKSFLYCCIVRLNEIIARKISLDNAAAAVVVVSNDVMIMLLLMLMVVRWWWVFKTKNSI